MPTSRPSQFIMSSDYSTLANDDRGDVSVTFPGSQAVTASGGIKSYTSDIELGSLGSSTRWRIASSKDSNKWFVGAQVLYNRTGTVSGSPASYSILATVTKSSATTVTVIAVVNNPYGATLTTEAGDETFQFHINTFIPPFV